ncbi:prepilin peptidase [Micrococcus endophyticus]
MSPLEHPAAGPAPYPLPPAAVRRGIGAGGALVAAAGVPALAATAALTPTQAHLLVCLIALAPLGIYIAAIDWAVRRIPNWAVAALALIHLGAAAGMALAGELDAAFTALMLALVAGVLFTAMHLLGGTGMGDVKFVTAAAAGLGVHGPGAWVLAVVLSYLLAAVLAAAPRLFTGRRHEKIPLGPYLVAGHLIVLLALLLRP